MFPVRSIRITGGVTLGMCWIDPPYFPMVAPQFERGFGLILVGFQDRSIVVCGMKILMPDNAARMLIHEV